MNLVELKTELQKMGYEVIIITCNGRRTVLFEDNISVERVRTSFIARSWMEVKNLVDKSDPKNWRKWYKLKKDDCFIELHNTLVKESSMVFKTHVFVCGGTMDKLYMKDLIAKNDIDYVDHFDFDKLADGQMTWPIQSGKFDGVSIGRDKDGFYCCTHRSRSKSYSSADKIPKSVAKSIERTGTK